MLQAYPSQIPAHAAIWDPAPREDTREVTAALIRTWLTILATGEPATDDMLLPIRHEARRRAVQGIDLQSLLRAYRVGTRVIWRELLAAPGWAEPGMAGLVSRVAERALDYAHTLATEVATAYMTEVQDAARVLKYCRSAMLDAILAGLEPEHFTGPKELCLPHCVVVAQVKPGLSRVQLEEIGQAFRKRADAGLWTIRYCSVVAAIPQPAPAARDELRQHLAGLIRAGKIMAAGIGGRSETAAETRSSYQEAAAALRAGSCLGLGCTAVYDYREFAPLIALMSEPGQADRFTAAVLEPLAELASRGWVLPTVEAYLARQGHLKEIAAALDVHPNTVKYRLRELRPYIGSSLSDGDHPATVLLALRVRRLRAAALPVNLRTEVFGHVPRGCATSAW